MKEQRKKRASTAKSTRNNARTNSRQLIQEIITLFASHPNNIWNYKQVCKQLDITDVKRRTQVSMTLEQLAEFDDPLLEVKPGAYRYNAPGLLVEATFSMKSRGRLFIYIPDEPDPIEVDERNSAQALDGDLVQAIIFDGAVPQARIVKVLQRKRTTFVGTLSVKRDFAIFTPDESNWDWTMRIPKNKLNDAVEGEKVVAKITRWETNNPTPEGVIVDRLGLPGQHNTEMLAILASHELPYSYPPEAEAEAAALPDKLDAKELAQREDCRSMLTLTIDPADAKDFDDALSYQALPDGKHLVGVHIADVSFYVPKGSLIDQEAYERATSVYLVDRTIPMLPERLSNDLCSLKPHEDRLAFSCLFTLNDDAQVENYRLVKTVINSDHRFSYEEVQEILDAQKGLHSEALLALNKLAQILRKRRFAEGAIDFESQEVRFVLDEQGKPISVEAKESTEANHLIEEFMLLTNRTVAQEIAVKRLPKSKKPKNFIYRVHAQPKEEKLAELANVVGAFGYRLNALAKGKKLSNSFNHLLKSIKNKGEEAFISTLAVRSMERAQYSTKNIGHYGLAFEYYSHFTSPIRRYPDLIAHRLLWRYLNGGRSVNPRSLEKQCQHCSEQEDLAARAERDSVKYKQVEYMAERIGKYFDGMISGVTEWGLYVELKESLCEGLVPMRFLDDDYYEYDERKHALVGRRSKKKYRLGDTITVKAVRADLEQQQIDFRLA